MQEYTESVRWSGERSRKAGRSHLAARLALPALFVLGAAAVLAATASAAPTVAILSPSEAATINSGTVPLALDIQNFTMNGSAFGQAAAPGEGHYHLYIDGGYVKADYELPAFLADVPEGAHDLKVELANNDHTLIGANATVNVTIAPGAPRVSIVSPASNSSWMSSSVELRISKANFVYNAGAVGQPAVAGEGHYHVNVNGAYFYYGTTEFFNVTYLDIGKAILIRVELANNDHTLLSGAVFDEIRITTVAGAKEFKLAPALFQAQVNASSLEASYTLNNFTIDPNAVGQPAVAGEGHYHVWLDGVLLGPATGATIPLTDLSVGSHTLLVELRNNNHAILSPRVVDWTVFTVTANAPRVTITSPTDPSTVNASSVKLAFTVGNFTLDAGTMGQANQAGKGHVHLSVDGVLLSMSADLAGWVSDLSAGPHIIRVELSNNDHSDLAWRAFDLVRVVVPAGAPRVTITSPAPSVTVNSSSVELAFAVENFTLAADKIGQPPAAGEGHWHLYVDGVYVDAGAGLSAVATKLTPGTHTLVVELHNNDHSGLAWPAFDQVTLTVPDGARSIRILSPTPTTTIALNWTTIEVAIANFTLAPGKIGQAAVAGEGHYHVFVDGAFIGPTGTAASFVSNLVAGTHKIRVELRNNDHSALPDSVFDEVTVTAGGLQPTIAITSPSDRSALFGDSTTVTVATTGFTLAPGKIGQAPVNGEGHWHVLIDGVYADASATSTVTVNGLAPGDRVVKVELHNNDHSALAVEVSASVTLHVAAVPSVRITAPAAGLETTDTTLAVTVALSNFTLESVGSSSTNVAGRGHLHVFVDGNQTSMVASTNFTVPNLAMGTHTIRVVLVNNDHTPVAAGQNVSEVTVTVRAPAPPPSGFLPGFGPAEALAAVAAVALIGLGWSRRKQA